MARPPAARIGKPLRTPATGYPGFLRGKRLQRVITRDIWGCLKEIVEFRSQRIAREKVRQARAYLEQAFEFYAAAENPQLASRPLLYYYSFLNLAKVFLLDSGVSFPPQVTHGIRDPRANVREKLRFEGQRVRIEASASDHSRIFPEFANLLGGRRELVTSSGSWICLPRFLLFIGHTCKWYSNPLDFFQSSDLSH